MRRRDFYFRQKVAQSELDAAFDDVEAAFKKFVQGFQYTGIALGAEATQAAVPNLTVDLSGPGIIYDQNQEAIHWSATQNVNCAVDENGASTAVGGGGNERWISIFAKFERTLTDPRIDGAGATVYFDRQEGVAFKVAKGNEALIGAATRPALRGDQILICDVKLVNAQTQILNADIYTNRTETSFVIAGSPLSIQERGLDAVLAAMVAEINNVYGATALLTADNEFTGENVFKDTIELTHADTPLGVQPRFELKEASIPAKTLIIEQLVDSAPSRYMRVYAENGGLTVTYNAGWDGTVWVPDSTATMAVRQRLHAKSYDFWMSRILPTTPANWGDAGWDAEQDGGSAQNVLNLAGGGITQWSSDYTRSMMNAGSSADDDASGDADNQKLLGKWKISNGAPLINARLYSCDGTGTNAVRGLIFTLNASWDGPNAKWVADDDTRSALGLRLVHAAGAATLEVLSKETTTVDWLDATGWDYTTSDLNSLGALVVSGVVALRQARSRVARAYGAAMNVTQGYGTGTPTFDGVDYSVTGGYTTYHLPIKIPERATLKKVRLDITPASGGACTLKVYKQTVGTFGTSGPTPTQLGSTATTAGAARQVLDSGNITDVADVSDVSYHAEVALSAATDSFRGIEVTWEYDELPEQFPPV